MYLSLPLSNFVNYGHQIEELKSTKTEELKSKKIEESKSIKKGEHKHEPQHKRDHRPSPVTMVSLKKTTPSPAGSPR